MDSNPLPILAITSLDPSTPPPVTHSISAVVTLVWPYSSSTRTCALLLGDSDFRLRHRRGQVRVRFTGPSATAVARQRVGIGHHVVLSLAGARWVEEDVATAQRTPGKSVEGELVFDGPLDMQFGPENEDLMVIRVKEDRDVYRDYSSSSAGAAETPKRGWKTAAGANAWFADVQSAVPIYSSPAFVRQARMSAGAALRSALIDPFEELETNGERARKKPRFSIQDIKSWRYMERSPSPEVLRVAELSLSPQTSSGENGSLSDTTVGSLTVMEDADTVAGVHVNIASAETGSSPVLLVDEDGIVPEFLELAPLQEGEGLARMRPPPLPQLNMPDKSNVFQNDPLANREDSQGEQPLTPKLQPISSDALPLPSPFPSEAAQLVLENSQLKTIDNDPTTVIASSSSQTYQRSVDTPGRQGTSDDAPRGVHDTVKATDSASNYGTNEHTQLQQKGQEISNREIHQASVYASVSNISKVHELSDTEEDDGEMYTSSVTGPLFASGPQEAEDATEIDTDEFSESAVRSRDGEMQSVMLPQNSDAGSPFANEELSVDFPKNTADMLDASYAESAYPGHTSNVSDLEPRTPVRPALHDFHLDGSADILDVIATKSTPQSEKDKVMAQTYRNLFGFTNSPIRDGTSPGQQELERRAQHSTTENSYSLVTTNTFIDHEPQDRLHSNDNELELMETIGQEHPIQGVHDLTSKLGGLAPDAGEIAQLDNHFYENADPFRPIAVPEQSDLHVEKVLQISEIGNIFENRREDGSDAAMQDLTDQIVNEQTMPTLDIRPMSSERNSSNDDAIATHVNEDVIHKVTTGFAPTDLSFPSTTVVASEYPSMTDPLSTEPASQGEDDTLERGDLSRSIANILPETDATASSAQVVSQRDAPSNVEIDISALSKSSPQPSPSQSLDEESIQTHSMRNPGVVEEEEHHKPGQSLEADRVMAKKADIAMSSPVTTASLDSQITFPAHDVTVERAKEAQETANDEASTGITFTEHEPEDAESHADTGLLALSRLTREQSLDVPAWPPTRAAQLLSPEASQTEPKPQGFGKESEVQRLQKNTLPLSPQLTQNDSLMKEAQVIVENTIPDTAEIHSSRQLMPSLDGPVEEEDLELSLKSTALKRQTRSSQKQNSRHSQSASQNDISQLKSPKKALVRRSPRKTQPLSKAETTSLTKSTAKATPTRRSSRLQGHGESQSEQIGRQKVGGSPQWPSLPELRTEEATHESFEKGAGLSDGHVTNLEMETQSSGVDDIATTTLDPRKELTRSHVGEEAATGPTPQRSQRTSARKSLSSRISAVPEAISAWFSPRRSSRLHRDAEEDVSAARTEDTAMGIVTDGIATSFSYFTPLFKIEERLNTPNLPFADNYIDILAISADDTKAPERAKGGPRDYYTTFHIIDPSLPIQSSVRVEVFRPWHAKLPVTQAGDVVLLRAYAVKSRKHEPYLLSTDASAWCVWRYGEDGVDPPASTEGPARAQRRPASQANAVREEVKGPPVELGDEERKRAYELRAWWQSGGGHRGA